MNQGRYLVVLGLAGVTTAAAGCKDQEARDSIAQVRDWIGPVERDAGGNPVRGQLRAYLDFLADAVCQVEVQTSGLDPAKRVCPDGEGPPTDKTGVPTFPPP